jgi:hypothetical protein
MKEIAKLIVNEWKSLTPKQKIDEVARGFLLLFIMFLFWVSLNIFY